MATATQGMTKAPMILALKRKSRKRYKRVVHQAKKTSDSYMLVKGAWPMPMR